MVIIWNTHVNHLPLCMTAVRAQESIPFLYLWMHVCMCVASMYICLYVCCPDAALVFFSISLALAKQPISLALARRHRLIHIGMFVLQIIAEWECVPFFYFATLERKKHMKNTPVFFPRGNHFQLFLLILLILPQYFAMVIVDDFLTYILRHHLHTYSS